MQLRWSKKCPNEFLGSICAPVDILLMTKAMSFSYCLWISRLGFHPNERVGITALSDVHDGGVDATEPEHHFENVTAHKKSNHSTKLCITYVRRVMVQPSHPSLRRTFIHIRSAVLVLASFIQSGVK